MVLMLAGSNQQPWSSVLEMMSWKESMTCAGCRYFEEGEDNTGFCSCPGGRKIRTDADDPACFKFQY